MGKVKLEGGGLQKLLDTYAAALKNRVVERELAVGSEPVQDEVKRDAIAALEAASRQVTRICQQGVLGILITPDE